MFIRHQFNQRNIVVHDNLLKFNENTRRLWQIARTLPAQQMEEACEALESMAKFIHDEAVEEAVIATWHNENGKRMRLARDNYFHLLIEVLKIVGQSDAMVKDAIRPHALTFQRFVHENSEAEFTMSEAREQALREIAELHSKEK